MRFSDCGRHIRKWDFKPFEGSAPYDLAFKEFSL
jgi:hypothetical protein